MGINHLGISSDVEHGGGVDGQSDVSEIGNVTLVLVRGGYSTEDVTKNMDANLLRVMREAEMCWNRLLGKSIGRG